MITQTPSDANHSFDLDHLRTQQNSLKRQGRMHWVHWLIVGLSVVITLFAWRTSENSLDSQEQSRFDREAERVVNLMQERIKHYEDALLSGVAAMQTHNGDMSRSQWKRYADNLDLTKRYPGISGIGVIHYVEADDIQMFLNKMHVEAPSFSIHPEHTHDLSLPIVYIEPEKTNAAAVGLDVAFETNRRTAALQARTTGKTQISGPIVLVQDSGKTPGFFLYAPYYDHRYNVSSGGSDAQREQYFKGLIYAPLVVKNLVEGVLSAANRQVTLSIRDDESMLYEERPQETLALYSTSTEILMNGRTWTFDISSHPLLHGTQGTDQPTVVLISGLCLDAMLFGLFWLMSRTNKLTLSMAESMTESLADQAQTLSENNKDLQSFAHVVSHDLKTPLRNIHSLIDIVDEDYGLYLASNEEGQQIKGHLQSLQDQATRGQSLINGVLEYSTIGSESSQSGTVDTRALVQSIAEQLKLAPNQIQLSGSFPTLITNVTLLEQVLNNLIGNAIKYNTNAEVATVTVSIILQDTFYHFSIKDNGPGIAQKYHYRIFQPFTTLNENVSINSSGIGLSIVSRAVKLMGGEISLDSAPGSGSVFRFSWPASQAENISMEQRHVAC